MKPNLYTLKTEKKKQNAMPLTRQIVAAAGNETAGSATYVPMVNVAGTVGTTPVNLTIGLNRSL